MEGELFFVDGLRPDRHQQRLARGHVMRGKNAGRKLSRPRRSRRPPQVQYARGGDDNEPPNICSIAKEHIVFDDDCQSLIRSKSTGSTKCGLYRPPLKTFPAPFEVSPSSIDVIGFYLTSTAERMYPAQLGISIDDAKQMYAQVLTSDEATFNCNLALMQACNEIFANDGHCSTIALHYLAQTFEYVQARLRGAEALSDTTVMILLSLVYQEMLRNYGRAAVVHFDGVASLIRLRGGISSLEKNRLLLLKVHKTDVILALQHGIRPKYHRDEMTRIRQYLGISDRDRTGIPLQRHELDCIFQDALELCSVFDSNETSRKLCIYDFQEITTSLSCRLLQLDHAPATHQLTQSDAVKQIGLLIFTMTIFVRYGQQRLVHFNRIGFRLQEVLNSDLGYCDVSLAFWASIIGGIWTSGDVQDQWLSSRTKSLAARLCLHSWEAARHLLASKFPWIEALHGNPGRRFWNRCLQV